MPTRRALEWIPPVAHRQRGLFTVAQALEAGATRDQARWRRERGHWVRYAGDAFARPDTPQHPHTDAVAAALTWPDATVCLSSAARFHELPVRDDGLVHVIVPSKRGGRARLQPHRLPLAPGDVVRVGPATVTSRRRTLLDCLGRLDRVAADELFAWAATRELLTTDDLELHLRTRWKAWGNVRRRQALEDLAAGAVSVAERRLHDLLRAAGIHGWEADQRVYDDEGLIARVDVLFRDARLVVEVDGYAYHSGREPFQRDRRRQNRLVTAGWTVLRFTWADLVERPWHVTQVIRTTLARRTAR